MPEILTRLPRTYGRYFEPFAGGDAVFFHLGPEAAVLSDRNPDLIGISQYDDSMAAGADAILISAISEAGVAAKIGEGMAKNIVTKGHPLVVLGHRNREPLEHLKSLGATEAKTPRELAAQCDIVHLCVTGSPQVEANLRGPDGVTATGRRGLIVIDCSTSNPVSTLGLGAELQAAGMTLVDAPLSRTPVLMACGVE